MTTTTVHPAYEALAFAEANPIPPQYEAGLEALADLLDLGALYKADMSVSVEDILRSRFFYGLEGVTQTPLETAWSPWDHLQTFDKLEVEQPVRAFKVRGAYAGGDAAMQRYPTTRHLVTHSAGNHGLGVAQFVKSWNIRTGAIRIDQDGRVVYRDPSRMLQGHIFVADGASPDKVERLQAFAQFGAELHIGGADLGQAEANSLDFLKAMNADQAADEPLAQQIHPYKNPDVMAGQATGLLETVFQLRDYYGLTNEQPLHYYVGYGGGGLANGSAVLMSLLKHWGMVHPDSKVIAVQMERCDSTVRALARLDSGQTDLGDLFYRDEEVDEFDASADGTAVRQPDPDNLALTRFLRDQGHLEVGTVTKPEVARIMRIHPAKPEPAGSLGAAGAEAYERQQGPRWIAQGPTEADRAVVVRVISGGNRSEATLDHFDSHRPRVACGAGSLVFSATHVHGPAPQPVRRTARARRATVN